MGASILLGAEVRNDMRLRDRSINGLYWRSHWCPRTNGQFGSSGVTRNSRVNDSPHGKTTGISTEREMMLASKPSRRRRRRGDIFFVATLNHATNKELTKQ